MTTTIAASFVPSPSRARAVGTRSRRPARAAQPNYTLRRLLAASVAIVVIAVAAIAASAMVAVLADVGGRPAAASDIAASSAAPIRQIHVASDGDTLWSIADLYRGTIDRGRYVDALIDLNGGTGIQIGQAVQLP